MKILFVVELEIDITAFSKARQAEIAEAPTVRDVVRIDVKRALDALPYLRRHEAVYIPDLLPTP